MSLAEQRFYKLGPHEIDVKSIVPKPDDPGPFGQPSKWVKAIERVTARVSRWGKLPTRP